MYENNYPKKRYQLTLDFVNQHIPKTDSILDLGVKNPLSELLKLCLLYTSDAADE